MAKRPRHGHRFDYTTYGIGSGNHRLHADAFQFGKPATRVEIQYWQRVRQQSHEVAGLRVN